MHRSILFALAVLLFAGSATAVDPECEGVTGDPPVYAGCQLKMTGIEATLSFCSPQLDAEGDTIPDGALSSCSVSLDGSLVETITLTEAGKLFTVTVRGKNPGHQLSAHCTNAEGVDGAVWTSDMCFPAGTPRRPHHRP